MSLITDFIKSAGSTKKFLAEMPKSLSEIKDFLGDFEKLVQHIEENIRQNEDSAQELETFLSDVRKNILTVFYYSLLKGNEAQAFYESLDVVISMYRMSNRIGTKFISIELSSTALGSGLLGTLMDRMEGFKQPGLKQEYLLKIWQNCISPVQQAQAVEGELLEFVINFIDRMEKDMEFLFLYTSDSSFRQVLSIPLASEPGQSLKTYTYFERDFVPALSAMFLQENTSIETKRWLVQFAQKLTTPGIYEAVLRDCLKRTSKSSARMFSGCVWLFMANPTAFLDCLSADRKDMALNFNPETQKMITDHFYNWSSLLSYSNTVITYKNRKALPMVFGDYYDESHDRKIEMRYKDSAITDIKRKSLDFLAIYLKNQASKGVNIFEYIKQLVAAVNNWVSIHSDPIFLKAVQNLLKNAFGYYYSNRPINNEQDEERALDNFFTGCYNNSSPQVRKMLFNGSWKAPEEPLSENEMRSDLFCKALSSDFKEEINVKDKDSYRGLAKKLLDPSSSYQEKITHIRKLKQNNLAEKNQGTELYLVKQMLSKANEDCGAICGQDNLENLQQSAANQEAESLAEPDVIGSDAKGEENAVSNLEALSLELDSLFEPLFFEEFVLKQVAILTMHDHKNVLIYLGQKKSVLFEKCLTLVFYLHGLYEKDGDKVRPIFDANPEKFVECLLKDDKAELADKRRIWILKHLLYSWISKSETTMDLEDITSNFRKYMKFIQQIKPVCSKILGRESGFCHIASSYNEGFSPNPLTKELELGVVRPMLEPFLLLEHPLSVLKYNQNLWSLIEMNPWMLEEDYIQQRQDSHLCSLRVGIALYAMNNNQLDENAREQCTAERLDEIVSEMLIPLCQGGINRKEIVNMLYLVGELKPEQIQSTHKLCMFIALVLCQLKTYPFSEYEKLPHRQMLLNKRMSQLIKRYSSLLSSNEEATLFDKCLTYVRDCYPEAGETGLTKVMAYSSGILGSVAPAEKRWINWAKRETKSTSSSAVPSLTLVNTISVHDVDRKNEEIVAFNAELAKTRSSNNYFSFSNRFGKSAADTAANSTTASDSNAKQTYDLNPRSPEEATGNYIVTPVALPATSSSSGRGWFSIWSSSSADSSNVPVATAMPVPTTEMPMAETALAVEADEAAGDSCSKPLKSG